MSTNLRTLSEQEIAIVSGGIACGGACIAAGAFVAGAVIGGGVTHWALS